MAAKPHGKSMTADGLGTPIANTSRAIMAFRTFVLNHLIHHRGQPSVDLRLMDVPVPPIYGPSADEG
jgi:uncharacterized damage-inducible protein DinB